MRKFNVTGLCIPEEDYMVDIGDKLKEIAKLNTEIYYAFLDGGIKIGR